MRFESRAPLTRKAALFFVGLSTAAALAGCGGAKPVASVNGEKLSEKEFQLLCENATQIQPEQATVGIQVLAQWIQNSMMAQMAKQQKVYPADKDLEARLDSIRKQAAFTGGNLEQQLTQQGRTMAAFRRDLLNSMVRENVMCQGITVSDQEVEETYNKQPAGFTIPEQVKISQITLDSEEQMKQAQGDLAANTQFSLVASTRSKDPFAQQGGQVPQPLPVQVPQGFPVSQQVVDAARKLKPGQVSDPIKVGATWVIVRLDEKIPEKKAKLEDVRELLRAQLRLQKAGQSEKASEIQKSMATFVQNAQVEINRPEYQSLLTQIKSNVAAAGAAAGGAGEAGGASDGHEGHNHPPGQGH